MAPIKTWAWSLPDPPPTTVMLQLSTSAQQKPRKRRSRVSSSADASKPAAELTALPAQPKNSSPRPDRSDPFRGTRQSNDVPSDGSRYSLFRGRKKGRAQSSTAAMVPTETLPISPSRMSPQEAKGQLQLQQDHFESEEDYYHHLKKMSISWPVDVQHLDRLSKKRPPPLDSSGDHPIEKRLPPKLASPQGPKHLQLQAIQVGYAVETRAANLAKLSHPPKPPCSPENGKDEPSSPVLCEHINEPQVDTKVKTESILGDELHDFPATHPTRLRRHTKESPSSGLRSPNQDAWKDIPTFDISSPLASVPFRNRAPSAASAKSKMTLPLVPVPEEDPVPSINEPHRGAEIFGRMKLPLPPLPSAGVSAQQLCSNLAQESTETSHSRPHSMSPSRRAAKKPLLVPSSSSELPAPLANEAFSTMLQSPGLGISGINGISKVPHSPNRTRDKTQSILSATSWEDDVDFSYEQEAESTCDFDWRTTTSEHPFPPVRTTVNKAANSLADPWIMTSPTSPGLYSPSLSESSSSIRRSISGRAHRYRGTSVGHRAFRLRHNHPVEASQPTIIEPLAPKRNTSITSTSRGSSHVVNSGDSGQPSKRHGRSGPLSFSELSAQIDYLSDPESLDWKRRISSSYGSCRSSLRRSHTEPAGDITRWSATSSSGVPDLLRSAHKSETSLHDQFSFCDLLDAHPHSAAAGVEDSVLPSQPQTPEPEQHFMRRPQTPSDRMILQNAGRAVQRGRIDRHSRSAPAVPTMSSPAITKSPPPRRLLPLDRMPQRDFEDWI